MAFSLDLPTLHRFTVGFDHQLDDLMRFARAMSDNTAKYPPYNVLRLSDNSYAIEVAVAGFAEDELTVEVQKNVLTIQGQKVESVDSPEYLYKGIGTRSFARQIPLAEGIEVKGAKVQNGVLTIELDRVIPEEDQPKRIAITSTK